MICSASNRRSLWETSLDHLVTLAQDIGGFEASAPLMRKHLRHVRWSSDYGYYLQLLAGCGKPHGHALSPT
jgi:hypothetical protein